MSASGSVACCQHNAHVCLLSNFLQEGEAELARISLARQAELDALQRSPHVDSDDSDDEPASRPSPSRPPQPTRTNGHATGPTGSRAGAMGDVGRSMDDVTSALRRFVSGVSGLEGVEAPPAVPRTATISLPVPMSVPEVGSSVGSGGGGGGGDGGDSSDDVVDSDDYLDSSGGESEEEGGGGAMAAVPSSGVSLDVDVFMRVLAGEVVHIAQSGNAERSGRGDPAVDSTADGDECGGGSDSEFMSSDSDDGSGIGRRDNARRGSQRVGMREYMVRPAAVA